MHSTGRDYVSDLSALSLDVALSLHEAIGRLAEGLASGTSSHVMPRSMQAKRLACSRTSTENNRACLCKQFISYLLHYMAFRLGILTS